MIRRIFCQSEFENVDALKGHSTSCEDHPAVQEADRFRGLLTEAAEWLLAHEPSHSERLRRRIVVAPDARDLAP